MVCLPHPLSCINDTSNIDNNVVRCELAARWKEHKAADEKRGASRESYHQPRRTLVWVCMEMRQSDPPDTWDVHTQGGISRFVSTMDPLPTGRVAFTLLNCSRVRDGDGVTDHMVNKCMKGSCR